MFTFYPIYWESRAFVTQKDWKRVDEENIMEWKSRLKRLFSFPWSVLVVSDLVTASCDQWSGNMFSTVWVQQHQHIKHRLIEGSQTLLIRKIRIFFERGQGRRLINQPASTSWPYEPWETREQLLLLPLGSTRSPTPAPRVVESQLLIK